MDDLRGKREEIDTELIASEGRIKSLEEEIEELAERISGLHPLDSEAKRLKVSAGER